MDKESKYTYYRIDFEDTGLDYDYTIVEHIEDIEDYIKAVDIDMDDDERKTKVIITGVAMTPKEFAEWHKENIKTMKTGVELIAQERKEQIEKHGFDLDKDSEFYQLEELKLAALYALTMKREFYPESWGFWWHDKMIRKQERMAEQDFYIEQLKIAGALIAAEIDRVQQSNE